MGVSAEVDSRRAPAVGTRDAIDSPTHEPAQRVGGPRGTPIDRSQPWLKAPRAIRYPARFRTASMRIARAPANQGRALTELARALAVAAPTLTHWLERPASPRLRPVTLEPTATREKHDVAGPVLMTPQGVRVEGLGADALIAVLRALA
jgi:hypothetical protein